MRHYFQTRKDALMALDTVKSKLEDNFNALVYEVDAGYYIHVYSIPSEAGENYDLSGYDLSGFGVFTRDA